MAYIRTVAGSGGTVDIDNVNNKATATTTPTIYTPDTNKVFADFTVNPQQHNSSTKYKPSANTASNDMGAVHNYRYVDTSGMYLVDQGTYNYGTVSGTGTKTISGLTRYNAVTFTVPAASSIITIATSKSSGTKQNFTDSSNKIDCSGYSGYSSWSASNFLVCPVMPSSNYSAVNSTTSSKDGTYKATATLAFKYQYTASSGIFAFYCFLIAEQNIAGYDGGNKRKAIPCNIYVKP